tara:strand:+ start:1395 stop:2402 length:1008 start_codon:yes stop_codon:yes gene_type:complete
MSKQLTGLLLKTHISDKNIQEQKKYLLDCLRNQGLIQENIEDDDVVNIESVCEICESDDIIRTNHELICNKCGAAKQDRNLNPYRFFKQDINFSKSSFIEPGELYVDVIKDGKTVRRDLSKINTWLSSDPEDQRIATGLRQINELIDKIRDGYNPSLFENVEKEIISMWYNALILNRDMYGKEKKAFLVWSIYYPIVYNDMNINIQRLASLTDIFIGDIYSYNFRLKDTFKGTSFEKYITIPIGSKGNIELSNDVESKIKTIKRNLKEYLKEPLKDKQLYGMINYISKNIPSRPFTLAELSEKSGISAVTILNETKAFETFYNKNLGLKNKLFIK